MKILIIKLSAIGDVIHTLPALNALRHHFPDAHMTWLVEEDAAPLVIGHEALDRVLVSKRKRWIKDLKTARYKSLRDAYRFIGELRDTEYDMVLDFQSLLKSGVLIWLSRGKRKIGFGKGMEHMERSYLFLNERIPAVDMEVHALSRGLILLEALGIKTNKVEYTLPIVDADRLRADELLVSQQKIGPGPLVAVHPIAKWETKLWDKGKFPVVVDRIIDRFGATVFFTGDEGDRPVIEALISNMKHEAINLAGQTNLKTLAALYERADLLVSTDTGPMHLAAAVGTPVVALFGPTAPWRTGPFGEGHHIVRAETTCSPCFKRRCDTKECMAKISADQVLECVEKLMA